MSVFSKKEITIIFIGALLSALSCFFYSTTSNTGTPMSMAISFVYVAIAFFLPLDQQLMFVALGLPNTKALGFGGISCSIIVCTIAVLKNGGKTRNISSIFIIALLYILYCTQFISRFGDYKIGLVMPIKTAVNLLFFFVLASKHKIASNSFDVGFKTVLSLVAGIISAFWISFSQTSADATRVAVEGNDPNMLAVESAFAVGYLCVYYYNRAFSKWLFLGAIICLSAISLYCGSRMGLLLMGFVVISSVLLNIGQIKRSSILIIVFGCALVSFLLSPSGQTLVEALIIRNENLENHGDISNHRFELWALYARVFNSDPSLWLIGLGNYKEYNILQPAHNFLIEDLSAYGLIGVLYLYFTYISIYLRQYRLSRRFHKFSPQIIKILPFLVPIIGGLTLHGLTSVINTTMLYLGVLCMTMPKTYNK